MQLHDILAQVPGARLDQGDPATSVTGIGHDSRGIRPGDLFVAMPGSQHDARHFVPQAIERGAVAVLAESTVDAPSECAVVLVPSARAALADAAAALHGQPSRKLRLVGVTGTDGKTSTTRLLAAILEQAGRRVGWLTTVDVNVGGRLRPNDLHHTTPEADRVQEVLAEMVAAGVEVAILETSSHALSLDRVRNCAFDLAIFTNLSAEHLNFHGTLADYRLAKARLFEMLGEPSHKPWPRAGVVNADDAASDTMRAHSPVRVLSYGIDAPADVMAREVHVDGSGAAFALESGTLDSGGVAVHVRTPLLGRFNVSNWLAAATAAFELGATPDDVVAAAATLAPVTGRMERIERGQPFLVVVDFAHTPQALENALRALRSHTSGRLTTVFGHAGERDPASRPAMGRVAAELSDFFVISMDDPLHEDPAEIARAIAAGATPTGKTEGRDFAIDLDRASAIRALLGRARAGDTVLLAGKGHERRMVVGHERRPWNDREEAEAALAELGFDSDNSAARGGRLAAG